MYLYNNILTTKYNFLLDSHRNVQYGDRMKILSTSAIAIVEISENDKENAMAKNFCVISKGAYINYVEEGGRSPKCQHY